MWLEKHLKKERKKKIKHFAASLLRHLHQRNTNGYNTQTTPRFGQKWNEIARFIFFVLCDADTMLSGCAFLLYLTDTLYDVARLWPPFRCVWDRRSLFSLHLPAWNELSLLLLRSVKLFCSLYKVSGEIIKYLLASFFFFFLTADIGRRGMKFCTNTKNIWEAVVITRVSDCPISVPPLCISLVHLSW